VNCFTYAARGLSYLALGQRALEIANMAAIAKFLFRATGSNVDDETVQTIIILCGMGPGIYLTRPEAIRAMMETILHILSKDRGDKPTKKAKAR
jgi:hypothetical protein